MLARSVKIVIKLQFRLFRNYDTITINDFTMNRYWFFNWMLSIFCANQMPVFIPWVEFLFFFSNDQMTTNVGVFFCLFVISCVKHCVIWTMYTCNRIVFAPVLQILKRIYGFPGRSCIPCIQKINNIIAIYWRYWINISRFPYAW